MHKCTCIHGYHIAHRPLTHTDTATALILLPSLSEHVGSPLVGRYIYTHGKVAVTQLQKLDRHTVCPAVGIWIPVCPVAETRTYSPCDCSPTPVSGPDSHTQTHFATLVPSPVT